MTTTIIVFWILLVLAAIQPAWILIRTTYWILKYRKDYNKDMGW